ncbi:fimbrial assembly protein [Pseudomonas sp. SWRI153]|uniref:Fimbrial assembly protein n=2 Tax=Pseudomonas khorasanensis TaxID=2745508 RepID=A0A923JEB5_9PSED|nr:CS1 type fimbrial major subunit [Pseudomonas khorasanensis]MBV4485295.1 fimbrial assembly protein [Pseudomonas khorasanensis]
MIRQFTLFALATATLLTGSLAWAAREQHTFEVSLEIPTRSFYIVPSEPGWIHQAQELKWDYPSSSLIPLRKYFDVRHSSSAIQARLEYTPYLSNGKPGEEVLLRVSFNGRLLSSQYQADVVSQADAAAGVRALLEIEAQKPAAGYRAGDYQGNVLLLFSAKTPG